MLDSATIWKYTALSALIPEKNQAILQIKIRK